MADEPDVDAATAAKAANRFDIRRIIGGLFLVYGVILTVVGIVGSDAVKNKAAGINVNLWTGLAMLVVGAMMGAWGLMRPTVPHGPPPAPRSPQPRRRRGPPRPPR